MSLLTSNPMKHPASTIALAIFLLGILFPTQTFAQDKTIWTDPKTARKEKEDFVFQGEYRGSFELRNEPPRPFGVQVVARGKGSFKLSFLPGGLPGDGWNGKHKFTAKSTKTGKKVVFNVLKGRAFDKVVLEKGRIKLLNKKGKTVSTARKVNRKSTTLGKKPPEDAVVLFDGTTRTLQKHWKSGANMTEGGLLKQGATSTYRFGDALLHIEFRIPFKPGARGQKRGNSGVYLQGRYEIQILDSFGLSGSKNQCGAIYDIRAPDVNMCYPPLSWQTYDIRFKAAEYKGGQKTKPARMTVRHNGVVIHKNANVKKATRAAPFDEGSIGGPLYLQDHGNPVRFRNIWVKPLKK